MTADYCVFGLKVRSAVLLPELFPASIDGEGDVTINCGTLRHDAAEDSAVAVADGLLVTVPTVGRFLVSDGKQIIVDAEPDADPRNVRLFLLGSVFGALLHQRGLLPLHANAVDVDGKAVAFMGEPGAGKSTLAAWFHDHGHAILSDDVCAIRFDGEGRAIAAPGLPRLRLWRDALDFTGRLADTLHRSYIGDDSSFEKFDVPIDAQRAGDREIPLAALCLLERGDAFSITPLAGLAAIQAIFENTYRGSFLSEVGTRQEHWESAVRLGRATPVFRITRKWDLALLEEQSQEILAQLRSDALAS